MNLFFKVGPLGDDGYHDVASLYLAVDLRETVTAQIATEYSVKVTGSLGEFQLLAVPTDESNLVALWRELAIGQGIRIDVCVAAAMRRGVLDETEAKGAGKVQFNLQAPFCLSGLGQLAEASLTADRFVQF